MHFLKKADLTLFLDFLPKDALYGTVAREKNITYEKIEQKSLRQVVLAVRPPVESIKGFFFPAKERVAVYPSQGCEGDQEETEKGQTLVGARTCDLAALAILDKIFLEGEVVDPFYAARRKHTLLITTDCVKPEEYCFCNLVKGQPFPEAGFDLNFSPIETGYLISSGSERGREILSQTKKMLHSVHSEQIAERDVIRRKSMEKLKEQNREYELRVGIKESDREEAMQKVIKESSACVECGACSYICPTCHCFLLFDQRGRTGGNRFERQKSWDSCILSNFAKMAGVGGFKPTPRPELRSRFENRIRHKFEWMAKNLNVIGCVGCGRCEAACMGGSDIRNLFKEFKL